MTYKNRNDAEAAMLAWAETTEAPALVLVQGDGPYRIVEADADGTVMIRPEDRVIATEWTNHSGGITELTAMNAYTVACCYQTAYTKEVSIRVPHDTKDLTPFLDGAIQEADQDGCWRACDDAGPTFIEAMSHGENTCAWRDCLPIPEEVSEQGPRPVVVVQTDNGHYDTFSVPRGDAHVIVLDSDGRSEPEKLPSGFDALMDIAEQEIQARRLLHKMLERIDDFAEECAIANETDTGVVWIVLNDFRERIVEIIGDAERLPF